MSTTSLRHTIKSWSALCFGLFCTGLALWSWVQHGELQHLIAALGFACWTAPWSQLEISLKTPLAGLLTDKKPLSPVMSALSLGGFLLIVASLILRWL